MGVQIYRCKENDTNTYYFTKDDRFISVSLESDYGSDINILNMNKENDIIFIPDVFPTMEDESPIIGIAHKYDGDTHVGESFVIAKILKSTCSFTTAKTLIEVAMS